MKLRNFQESTVSAVLKTFDDASGPRRFLVADEPGLGKTVVARHVLARMAKSRRNGLTALYVCSNQAIASQNVDQLLGSKENVKGMASRTVADRPGLLPLNRSDEARLRIYSLTPNTAFANSKARLPGRGRVDERAFACALIEQAAGKELPRIRDALSQDAARFGAVLTEMKRLVREREHDAGFASFRNEFHKLLAKHLPGRPDKPVWDLLLGFGVDAATEKKRTLQIVALCRNCLAAAALSRLKVDVVIFDEFQRFQGLLEEPIGVSHAERRIREILTAADKRGRVLLLSATPYEALRASLATAPKSRKTLSKNREKPEQKPPAHDFYHLLRFLWRNQPQDCDKRIAKVREDFAIRDLEMRRGEPNSKDAQDALARITKMLSTVVCRTERPIAHTSGPATSERRLSLDVSDVSALRDFSNWIQRGKKDYSHWAVPLWSSVPMPAQTLGRRYACWLNAFGAGLPVELRQRHLRDWNPPAWSNTKLRWLLDGLPVKRISMPWLRPTVKWWPLRGGWAADAPEGSIDGKALVFSRFAATPAAIAGSVSFAFEAQAIRASARARPAYKNGERASFRKGGSSPAMFRLFFLCDLLLRLNPLRDGIPQDLNTARKCIADQLVKELEAIGITVRRKVKRKSLTMETWLTYLSGRTSKHSESADWRLATNAWTAAVRLDGGNASDTSIKAALNKFAKLPREPIKEIHYEEEFKPLVDLALSSPGIVMARAALRHWKVGERDIALDEQVDLGKKQISTPRQLLQALVLDGFKTYLDKPWFAAVMTGRANILFPDAIAQGVLDGNLEATLDEHFWFISATTTKPWPKRIAELRASLKLGTGRTYMNITKAKEPVRVRVRCKFALPLHQAKDESQSETKASSRRHAAQDSLDEVRPDVVRHAFNTPFWPMVLTSTSVGQEGLDFHAWCKTIVHWDPAAGPIELEQREGRVNRFAGLAIRQAVWTQTLPAWGSRTTPVERQGWRCVAVDADKYLTVEDSSGLSPWWCASGAKTEQLYPYAAGSREALQRSSLERRRAMYRMVLGASDPGWLLAELDKSDLTHDQIESASLQLGAWALEQPPKPLA